GDAIGMIEGGRRKSAGLIDIAMVQSLARRDHAAPDLTAYGHVVDDGCHHVPAVSIERVLADCSARFVTGLTATPARRDGHQPITTMPCGPTRHTIADRRGAGFALRAVRRHTDFEPSALPSEPSIQRAWQLLWQHREVFVVERDAGGGHVLLLVSRSGGA